LKTLEKNEFSQWLSFPWQWLASAPGIGRAAGPCRPWGSQLLRVAGVHSFPVTGLFDDPFELLHLFRPEPREPREREPRPRPDVKMAPDGSLGKYIENIGKMMEKKMMEIRNTCIQMYTNINLSTFVSI